MSKEVVLSESTKRLAEAIQICLQEATQVGREQFREEIRTEMNENFSKQNATLRIFWKQMKGEDSHEGPLPIDD